MMMKVEKRKARFEPEARNEAQSWQLDRNRMASLLMSNFKIFSPQNGRLVHRQGEMFTALIFCLLIFSLVCFVLDIWMLKTMEECGISLVRPGPRPINAVSFRRNERLPLASSKTKTADLIYEMPPARLPPFYIMIPSMPRKDNVDYLLQVLPSFVGFPMEHVYVFHNGVPGQAHSRWEEARELYPKMHFIRNKVSTPPGHPSIYNRSVGLPAEVQKELDTYNDTTILLDALHDTLTRLEWRRNECFDFTAMSRYMLNVVDQTRLNETWIIFNQDDAKWKVSFPDMHSIVSKADNKSRVDLSREGLVSVAMRAPHLAELLDFASLWCDFLPVDWVVWKFYRTRGYCTDCVKAPRKYVLHIGKVSSRLGIVDAEKQIVDAVAKKQNEMIKERSKKRTD